jgi:hypothetical protein
MNKTGNPKTPAAVRRYIAGIESRRTHTLLRHAVPLEELLKENWMDHLAISGHSVVALTSRRWRVIGFELVNRTRWRSHRTDDTAASIGKVCDWIKEVPTQPGIQSALEPRLLHVPELGLLAVVLHGSADQILFVIRAGSSGLDEGQLVARCRYQPQLRAAAEQRLHPPAPAPEGVAEFPGMLRQRKPKISR